MVAAAQVKHRPAQPLLQPDAGAPHAARVGRLGVNTGAADDVLNIPVHHRLLERLEPDLPGGAPLPVLVHQHGHVQQLALLPVRGAGDQDGLGLEGFAEGVSQELPVPVELAVLGLGLPEVHPGHPGSLLPADVPGGLQARPAYHEAVEVGGFTVHLAGLENGTDEADGSVTGDLETVEGSTDEGVTERSFRQIHLHNFWSLPPLASGRFCEVWVIFRIILLSCLKLSLHSLLPLLQLLNRLHFFSLFFQVFPFGFGLLLCFSGSHFLGKGLVLLTDVLEALRPLVQQEGLILLLVLFLQQPVLPEHLHDVRCGTVEQLLDLLHPLLPLELSRRVGFLAVFEEGLVLVH